MRRRFVAVAVLPAALLAGAASGAGSQQRFVMGSAVYPMPDVASPAKGKTVRDPVFSTRIVRVTDKARDRYRDKGIENEYARSDPENKDGTLLVLRGTEANWELYDARSFKRVKLLTSLGDSQEAEPRWDFRNAGVLYHLRDMKLLTLDVRSGREAVVHDFRPQFPKYAYIGTGSEGDASLDRRYWCFGIKDAKWQVRAVVVYDRVDNRIVGTKTSIERPIDSSTMDMSGRHCVLQYDNGDTRVYTRTFSTVVTLPAGSAGHADVARTAAGRDVLVYQDVKTDWVAMADLDTGAETRLLHIPFGVNADIGLHFSGNLAAKGWVLVSTYGAREPPAEQAHSWMDRQLFMLELKPQPRIWRVAHTNAILSVSPDEEKHYFAEAFAAVTTRGTKIYWGSNWGQTDLDRVETYAALLPERWWTKLPSR